MKTIIQKIEARPGQRIIAMSDIHGHLDNMVRLLERLGYGGEDILVLVGDLVDKGPDSLRTLRYIMQLSLGAQVYVSEGNVDGHRLEVLCDTTEGSAERFLGFIDWQQAQWGCGLLLEMLAELGICADQLTVDNVDACRKRLWEYYAPEIHFLQKLPTILEMDSYLFVHGGIPTDDLEKLAGTDRHNWLKNDCFLEKGYRFSKCVVTGHWPVSLYRHEESNMKPIFDYDRRIICMDGGCGLQAAGQLNALVFADKDVSMEEIRGDFQDGLPVLTALDQQDGKPFSLYIQYLDSEVEWMEKQEDMVLCRQISSGRKLWVPDYFLYRGEDGIWRVDNYSDAQLTVKPGDRISVVYRNAYGCYGKINGIAGWYYGRCSMDDPAVF